MDEGGNGTVDGGAAAPGGDGREADGAPGPSGNGTPAAEDPSEFLAGEGEDPGAYAARIFQRVFCNDIESVLRMDVRCSLDLSALPALALFFGVTCTSSGLQLPTWYNDRDRSVHLQACLLHALDVRLTHPNTVVNAGNPLPS